MKAFNLFSLVIMVAMALFTFSAIASPVPARNVLTASNKKVHLLENLDADTLAAVQKILSQKGYQVSLKPLFTEHSRAIIVTQKTANEVEAASIEIEMVKMDKEMNLPKTVFKYEVNTIKAEEALSALPRPEEILESDLITPLYMEKLQMLTQQLPE